MQSTLADYSHTEPLSKMTIIVIRSSVTQSLPVAVSPGFAKVLRLQYDVADPNGTNSYKVYTRFDHSSALDRYTGKQIPLFIAGVLKCRIRVQVRIQP